MLKLLDSTLGYYLPSFLYIYTEEHIAQSLRAV